MPEIDVAEFEGVVADARARAIANDTLAILHFVDEEAFELAMGADCQIDMGTFQIWNRIYAKEFAALGRDIEVQIVAREAYASWLDGRVATREDLHAFTDPERLLTGQVALSALDLAIDGGKGMPIADELTLAFVDEDEKGFAMAVERALAGAGDSAFDEAIGKMGAVEGASAALAMAERIRECTEIGPSPGGRWVEILAFPVMFEAGALPTDTAELARVLPGCGLFRRDQTAWFRPGWRDARALAELSPAQMRRTLDDLILGREPELLPALPEGAVQPGGLLAIVGHALSGPGVPVGGQAAFDDDEAERQTAFAIWRDATFDRMPGVVAAMNVVPPSRVLAEAALHQDGAPRFAVTLSELSDFVAMAKREAAPEEITCAMSLDGDATILTLTTRAGVTMDIRRVEHGDVAGGVDGLRREMARLVELAVFVDRPSMRGASSLRPGSAAASVQARKPVLQVIEGGLSVKRQADE